MSDLPNILAFVDIETTGASFSKDSIIDIGIVRVEKGKVVQRFSSLVDPDCYLPPEITRLTGITETDLRGAPTFTQIQDQILELLDGAIFVAHNVEFDYRFLKHELKRRGATFSAKRFCTVRLSRLLYPQYPRHNLDSVIERHNIAIENRHRGLGDAQAICSFYQKMCKEHPKKRFEEVINLLLKKPNTPIAVNPQLISSLPEHPGVYIMYGRSQANDLENIPLYIGKSKNIKKRVASHFSSSNFSATGMKLATQTTSIEAIKTAGELEALLKESALVKKFQPLYNKKLRRAHQIIALTLDESQKSYWEIKTEVLDTIDPEKVKNILGIFRSVKQAKEFLTKKAEEFSLCDKFLNLEKTKRGCFGHMLGRCRGACEGKENYLKYNLRISEAFSSKRFKPWPFASAIFIEESQDDKQTIHVVDRWCYLGTVDTIASETILKSKEHIFDVDTYKILYSFISSPKNKKYIKPANFAFANTISSEYI